MKALILLLLLTTILWVTVNGYIDEWNLIQSKKSYLEIYDCLNSSSELWNELGNHIDTAIWKNYFLTRFLREFQWRTLHIEYVNRTLTNILTDLIRRNQLGIDRAGQVRVAIFNALLNCTNDDERVDKKNEFVNQSNYHSVPNFHYQPFHLSELLNLILVDTENHLEHSTLVNFARNALRVLELALERSISFGIMATLRLMWRSAAENYFDFANEVPYIRHTYSMNSLTVYTHDDPNLFNTRALTDFIYRNAPASRLDISRILSFHPHDRENQYRDIFYSLPSRLTMTQADTYYEIHENQFFRVILFYLELVDRGYVDSNGHVLTDRPISEDLIQLLHNDTYYGPYLEIVTNRELDHARFYGSSATDRYVNSIGQHNRILEPDVIMLFYHRLRSSITTLAIPTSTTVSSIDASSTPVSENSSNEKEVTQTSLENDNLNTQKKHNNMGCKDCYYYDPDRSYSKNFQNLQPVDLSFNTISPDNLKQLFFPEKEETSLEFFQDIFSTMIKSVTHFQLKLTCH